MLNECDKAVIDVIPITITNDELNPVSISSLFFDRHVFTGSRWDNNAQLLRFERPEQYNTLNMRVKLWSRTKDFEPIMLGINNELALSNAYTQSPMLGISLEFFDGEDFLSHSNREYLYFRSSKTDGSDSVEPQIIIPFPIPGPIGETGGKGDKGDKGSTGKKGTPGKSAYASAVEGGYTGTEEQFYIDLASVEGVADTLTSINADLEVLI